MKIFTLFASLFFAILATAQEQPGYYITSGGQRTEGFFKTSDFFDASALEFRSTEEQPYTTLNVDNVDEYGITGQFKFEKHTVALAEDNTPSPIFLNVIVEGDATLYSYHNQRNTLFYYTVKGKQPTPVQLGYIHSRARERRDAENNRFRQQLAADVSCSNTPVDMFDRLQYTERDLADVFTQYNACIGAAQVVYANESAKKTNFHVTAYVGIYNTTFKINNLPAYNDASTISFGMGFEAAYRFPSETLELFAKAEFENFSATIKKDFPQPSGYITNYFDIDATVIDVFVGPRYNLKIGKSNKIFVDAAIGVSVPFGHMREYSVLTEGAVNTNTPGAEHELDTAVCGNFGLGYTYNNKYGIVIRYETDRKFTNQDNTGNESDIQRIGVALRYTFN